MHQQQTNILFVCTGNTCRSPMAEAIVAQKAKELNIKVNVQSAGVCTVDGLPMSPKALLALEDKGISLASEKHVSQQVKEELLSWADTILTMTVSHRNMLVNQYPNYESKIFNLSTYSNNEEKGDVSDPFGASVEIYKQCANELELMIAEVLCKAVSSA